MKAQVVSFHCVVKTQFGVVISSTFNQDVITAHANPGKYALRGFVEGLQDLQQGEKRSIAVKAEGAYGFYDPKKVIVCATDCLEGKAPIIGESLMCEFNGKPTQFRLTAIDGEEITLDANHPLAGQDLVFEIETVEVREALPEEIPGGETKDETSLH